MKKKLLSLSLALAMVLSFSVPAMAAPTTVFNVDFTGNAINDYSGNTWTQSDTLRIENNTFYPDGKWMELEGADVPTFVSTINDDKNFYVDMEINFQQWDTDKHYLLHADGSGTTALSITYDKDYNTNGAWRIRMMDATAGAPVYYIINDNLSLNTDYKVIVAREGNDIKVYRDSNLIGSAPLATPDTTAVTGIYIAVGMGGTDGIYGVKRIKFVGDAIYTQGGEEVTSVGVTGGDLKFTPDSILFSSVKINQGVITNSTATSKAEVNDERGNGGGFVIQAAGAPFYSEALIDPSSGGSATVIVEIPVNAMSLTVGAPNVLSGQPVDATYGPLSNNITMSTSAQTIFVAQAGYGMGHYEVDLGFNLIVPKTGTVASVTGTGSKYEAGDVIGIPAGTYWSKVVYTVAAPL